MSNYLVEVLGLDPGLSIIISLFFYFLAIIIPVFLFSAALRDSARIKVLPLYLRVINITDDYFDLENNVRLYRKYYDKNSDIYETPYGTFIPVRSFKKFNEDVFVKGFMYVKK